jgi:uncharacterized membrane protein
MGGTETRKYPVDPERAWVVTAAAAVVVLVAGSVTFTGLVYDRFIWRHFLGRMMVDARNARCAARIDGQTQFLYDLPAGASTCFDAFPTGTVVANEQYTLLSEAGYILILLFLLAGVVFLLRRLKVAENISFLYAMVPFMLFGAALRVVEDASNVAASVAGETIFPYPWNVLAVSPVIYFTGAVLVIGLLVVTVTLERRGVVEDYVRPTAAVGVVFFLAVMAFLAYLAATRDFVTVHVGITVVTLVIATVLSVGAYYGLERYYPSALAGTGVASLVVVWAHAVDGVANVVVLDWAYVFGLQEYFPKHPVNQAVITFSENFFPASLNAAIGTAWPFLMIKLLAAMLIVAVFDDITIEENPRYAMLLLVTATLVGLGPGARDMIRATFAV